MSTPPYSACKLPRKRAKRSLLVYAFILISLPLFTLKANAIDIDKALPALSISDGGEITLDNGKAKFIAWTSDTLADKVTLLQVLAASQEAAAMAAKARPRRPQPASPRFARPRRSRPCHLTRHRFP